MALLVVAVLSHNLVRAPAVHAFFGTPAPEINDLQLTNVPANITVNATKPQGAVVTYTLPTVVDEDSPLPPVSCDPASGSTFVIGVTTVTCTVTDSDDTNSPVSAQFTVMVKSAAAQVSDLLATVNGYISPALPVAQKTPLDNKLQAVQTDLTGPQPTEACSGLSGFIGYVNAQTGHGGVTATRASALIAAAKNIQAVLGCSPQD
jgi:hypothetical protein